MHDSQRLQPDCPLAIPARAVIALAIALLVGNAGCKREPPIPAATSAARPAVAVRPPVAAPTPRRPSRNAAKHPPRAALPASQPLAKNAIPATLKRADAALIAGHYDDGDDSALAQYRDVLAADPANATAREGMETLHVALFGRAQAALLAGDVVAAQRDADRLQQLFADDPAVAALTPRLAQAWKIDSMLAQASRLEAAGHAIAPFKPNAAEVYRQVQSIEAGNAAAEAGLSAIENDYIAPALAAAQAGHFPESDQLIAQAARVRPDSQALLDASKRIVEIRQRTASVLQAQADSALAVGDANRAAVLLPQIERAAPLSKEVQDLRSRIALTRIYGTWRPGQSFTEGLHAGGRAPEMIVIPAGEFRMGSEESEPDHDKNEAPMRTVVFKHGFAMARDEITVAQFAQFVNATHYRSDAERAGSSLIFDEAKNKLDPRVGVTWREDSRGRTADPQQPLIHVSWNDAIAYALWLTRETGHVYRLPSEAEFEYALRAGSRGAFPWPGIAPPPGIGNLTGANDVSPGGRHWGNAFAGYGDGFWGPAPVGHFRANAFGLYDMVGNVSEWVQDCWHEGYRRAPVDGIAWMNPGCPKHVVRGTSWASAPEQARSAYRQPAVSASSNARVGFRLVRGL